MLAEKIIFNILAFSLFIYILLKMFKKNDTSYLSLLIFQAVGIGINLIEILKWEQLGIVWKVFLYAFAIILPIVSILVEKKGVSFLEFKNVLIARVCILLRRNKLAKKMLTNITNKYENSYIAHKLLAEVYEKEGGMRKAIDEYVQTIDIRKNDYQSYYKIGELLKDLEQKEESITILNNLINKKPEYIDARIVLSEILYEKEEFKDAIGILSGGIQYNELDYRIYYNLGMAYARINDFENSKSSYEKAIDLNNKLYMAYYNLGQIALLYDEKDKAEKYFSESLNIDYLKAKSLFQLSRINLIDKQNQNATELINQALEEDDKIIEDIDKEPLFVSIRREINTIGETKSKGQLDGISENEELVIKHLEQTYEIIRRMGMQK